MRWILLLVAVAGFAIAFSTRSPGLMGFGLVAGFVALVCAFFAFAAVRIESTSRPDVTMLTDKDINTLKASLRKPAPATPPAPPQRVTPPTATE